VVRDNADAVTERTRIVPINDWRSGQTAPVSLWAYFFFAAGLAAGFAAGLAAGFLATGALTAVCVRAEALTFLLATGASDLGALTTFAAMGAAFAAVFSVLANLNFLFRKDED
jgi:hypothetical protein